MSRVSTLVVSLVLFTLSVSAAPGGGVASLASPDFDKTQWRLQWGGFDVRSVEVDETPGRAVRTFYVSGDLGAVASIAANATAADERATERDFLEQIAPLIGVEDVSRDLVEVKRGVDDRNRRHVVLEKSLFRIPIRDGEVAMHIAADGTIYAFAGSVPAEPDGWRESVQKRLERATVTQDQALAAANADALARSGANARIEKSVARKRLVTTDPLVIWEVDVIVGNGGSHWLYDIDAVTGQIHAVQSLLQSEAPRRADASGQLTETVAPPALNAPPSSTPVAMYLDPAKIASGSGQPDQDGKPAIVRRPIPIESNATQTVFFDDFEGPFPSGLWRPLDANGTTYGEVYWDDSSYRPYQGSWSLWCADGGANGVGAGGSYLADMASWAIWGPFSMTGTTGGSVSLRYWLKSELNYDFLLYMVSIDGYNFYGWQTSGDTAGWTTGTLDLANVPTLGNVTGQPNVWFAVYFVSDGTINYEGAYVDNVLIQKQTPDGGADLSLQTLDATNGSYAPGGSLVVQNTTTNIGNATSPTYRITFYASTNTSISTSDTAIGYVDRAALGAGASHSFNTTMTIPSGLAAGSYYIGAILTVTDANSGNNTNYDPTPITITGSGDTTGPKIGTGLGVLSNTQSHIDTHYDPTVASTYLMRDITRRASTNPHGHNGGMGASSLIETDTLVGGISYVADDIDNTWNASYEASAVDQHVYTGKVYDYLKAQLSLNGIDGAGRSMFSLVDVDGSEDGSCSSINAFWNGSYVQICSATGGILPLSGALDVVAHEWGHAVTELAPLGRSGSLTYQKESGALNEAFSDWIGNSTEHWAGETNWTLGEGVYQIRNMANPPQYQQPAIYGGTYWYPVTSCTPVCDGSNPNYNDCCGVHTNSGVGNKMFYLLAQGSGSESGGVFNGVSVTGIGVQTAMAIALDANRNHWPANATYSVARAGMIDSAGAYGAGAVNSVMNAWAAVGVGSAACTSFNINSTSASPSSAAGSQSVTITATPSGCAGARTASGNGSWLTVSPTSGNGAGSVTVSWTQNTSASSRTGTATIAGRTFTVTQAGSSGGTGGRVRGDFNGDRLADIAVFRPTTGIWYSSAFYPTTWGQYGDIPVPADYNGDGREEIAVWRPSTGIWYSSVFYPTTWGQNGDIPVPGDYNGDGRDDIAVWRPSTGMWYSAAFPNTLWGQSGDIPVPADYNGDGRTDIAVFRPSTGMWYSAVFVNTLWGQNGDIPVPADYNGDGRDDIAVFRPSTGIWYSSVFYPTTWGQNGDVPVPADYNGDGRDDIAVWRPSTGMWYSAVYYPTLWGQSGDFALTSMVGSRKY